MKNPAKIFLCSTRDDLLKERKMVLEGIYRLHLQHDSMESFGARDNPPIETCLEEVKNSDILVVVVGQKYGTYVSGSDISYSEAEYNEAYRLNIPCLIYFKNDNVRILPRQVEQDADKLAKLNKWKEILSNRHTPYYFQNSTDLALQVIVDLSNKVGKKNIPRHIFLFDSDPENTFFIRYFDKHNTLSGNFALAFYDMSIVNVSDRSYTVKDVSLEYEYDGITHSTDSMVIPTKLEKSGGKTIESIKVQKAVLSDFRNIYLGHWQNIRTQIAKRKILTPGSVLHGSALFVLKLDDFEKLSHLKNMRVVIRDFSGNSSVQLIEIQDRWLEMGKDLIINLNTTFRHTAK